MKKAIFIISVLLSTNISAQWSRRPLPATEFNLISYNVAGLPRVLSIITKQKGHLYNPMISPLLNDYDIVLVQEDFSYHNRLVSKAYHPYQSRHKRSGFFRLGDGLNRLSEFPFQDFERIKWKKCTGDSCLTPKGFTVATHNIEGEWVDIYNLHGNSGSSSRAERVIKGHVDQLIKFIKVKSKYRGVILAGDFNLHASIPFQKELINKIQSELFLTDAFNGSDNVDRIFYSRTLEVVERFNHNAKFVSPEGDRLSDHNPLIVRFKLKKY